MWWCFCVLVCLCGMFLCVVHFSLCACVWCGYGVCGCVCDVWLWSVAVCINVCGVCLCVCLFVCGLCLCPATEMAWNQLGFCVHCKGT